MNWLSLTILSVFFLSFASVLQKVLMKNNKSDAISYAIIFHLIIGFLNLFYALTQNFQLPAFDINLFFLVLAAVLWSGAVVFYLKGLKLLELSEVSLISSAKTIVTIVASIVLLHEAFTLQKFLGVALIIGGILLVMRVKSGVRLNKGTLYILGLSLCAGLAIVADSYNLRHYEVASYNTITNFISAFFLIAVFPKSMKNWKNLANFKFLSKMLLLGIFSTVQGILYLSALSSGRNTIEVGTIREATTVLTILFSAMLLGESDRLLRKLVAAGLVIAGVLLLR